MLHWSNTAYPHAHIKRRVRVLCVSHHTHAKGQTGKTDQIIIVKKLEVSQKSWPQGMSERHSQSLPLVPAGVITKRQSCYLSPFIPVAFDVFNAICTQECDEVLLLPFHIWGKRDIASYSEKVLEHLMPLEISCSGALKYLGKTHTPEGFIQTS